MDTLENYKELAEATLSKTRSFIIGPLTPDEESHVINIARSVMTTRDNVMMGGSFAQAIVNNDLREAVNRADDTCIRALKFFTYCRHNIFLPATV